MSAEGPLKVPTSEILRGSSGDSQGTNTIFDDLITKLYFGNNSPLYYIIIPVWFFLVINRDIHGTSTGPS